MDLQLLPVMTSYCLIFSGTANCKLRVIIPHHTLTVLYDRAMSYISIAVYCCSAVQYNTVRSSLLTVTVKKWGIEARHAIWKSCVTIL